MAQVNGSPFKLVFSDWWYSRKYLGVTRFKFPFPNGLHPAFLEKATQILSDEKLNNPILLEKSHMRSTMLSDSFQQKDLDTNLDNGNFFRHGNFLGYWHKFFNQDKLNFDYIVSPEQIDENDNDVYYYPIEVELNGLRLISERVNIKIDDKIYDYKLVDLWSDKLLSLFRSGKVKILIINIVDASGPIVYIKEFEDEVVKKGIDPKNLVWLQGNVPNYYYEPNRVHKSYMINGCLSLRQAADNLQKFPVHSSYTANLKIISDVVRQSDLDPNKIRPHKFLSFNRTMDRPHRVANAYLALKHDLLKEGIFSFLNHRNPRNVIQHLKMIYPDLPKEELVEYSEKIIAMLPYEVDTQPLSKEEKESFQNIDVNPKEYYINSYLNIVTETNGGDEIDAFWSEKIWRPILNLQPFILIGPYKSLSQLHQLGFKTFSPFINEAYDSERDPKVRIQMIEKEILKFKNMSLKEIHDWYYSITHILLHNQQNILNHKDYNPLQNLWKLSDEFRK